MWEQIKFDRKEISIITGLRVPFEGQVKISQGYNGPLGHFPMHFVGSGGLEVKIVDDTYCIDFELPIETDVFAAANGRVFSVHDNSSDYYDGADFEKGQHYQLATNFIYINSGDFVTCYAHLAPGSALARPGQIVKKGEKIAKTGLSGWVGPTTNLHFMCGQINPFSFVRKLSNPVEFENYSGPLHHKDIQ